jgi:hypothetical protein
LAVKDASPNESFLIEPGRVFTKVRVLVENYRDTRTNSLCSVSTLYSSVALRVSWLGRRCRWICWTCPNPKNRSGQVRVTFELSTAWTSPRMGGHRNCSRAFFRGDGIRCSSKCPAVTQKIRSKAMVWRFWCYSVVLPKKKKSWSLWEYEYIYLFLLFFCKKNIGLTYECHLFIQSFWMIVDPTCVDGWSFLFKPFCKMLAP